MIVFGVLLLAVDRATSSTSDGVRFTSYALAGVCALFVVGAVVTGIYAMAHKPKSAPAKPTKSAQARPEPMTQRSYRATSHLICGFRGCAGGAVA